MRQVVMWHNTLEYNIKLYYLLEIVIKRKKPCFKTFCLRISGNDTISVPSQLTVTDLNGYIAELAEFQTWQHKFLGIGDILSSIRRNKAFLWTSATMKPAAVDLILRYCTYITIDAMKVVFTTMMSHVFDCTTM